LNVYAETGKGFPYLYATWFGFDEPEMDSILEEAKDGLDQMFEDFKIEPVNVHRSDRIFLARFEFPAYDQDFKHPDGAFNEKAIGFVDFLVGFPFHCIETLGCIGEWSSDPEKTDTVERTTEPIPFAPRGQFFKGFEAYLANYTGASAQQYTRSISFLGRTSEFRYSGRPGNEYECRSMAQNLEGTDKPRKLHFWLRLNIIGADEFPIPGEFLALCCRIFPNLPWGKQGTNPYVFSGNWMDTVFYSSGRVLEVQPDTEDRPYNLYTIKRRGETVAATPIDFAQHGIKTRCTILKNPLPDVRCITWEDDKTFQGDWAIAPVLFYGK
jgi:hypothetical protein